MTDDPTFPTVAEGWVPGTVLQDVSTMPDLARELALTIANGGAFTDDDAVMVAQAYLELLRCYLELPKEDE